MYSAMFSDEEALRIAAQIERKGERFYRVAQKLSDSQEMTNLLELLRRQEEAHAARFESMLDELLAKKGDFEDEAFSEESAAFLSALASEVVFPGGVMASMMNRKIDTIPDLLLYAISTEKDSILFYMELVQNTKVPENIPVFQQIIQEEKRHLFDLQRMLEETKGEENRL